MKKKYVFIQGRQEKISDVVSFLANMIAFTKIRTEFGLDVLSSHPTLVQIYLEIGKELKFNENMDFFCAHKKFHGYMTHTLVVAILNIFTIMTKAAKHPEALHRMKYSYEVAPNIRRQPIKMAHDLLGQICMAVMADTLGYLFAYKPLTYKLCFLENTSTGGDGTLSTAGTQNAKKDTDSNRKKGS